MLGTPILDLDLITLLINLLTKTLHHLGRKWLFLPPIQPQTHRHPHFLTTTAPRKQ
jgi:hypothetical protein